MQIVGYDDIDRAEWSRLVQTSATGTWFQTPEAYEFFASQPELFKPFVVAVKSQELRAVCVWYETGEKNAVKQFFTRRAIIIGGPCLADDCTNEDVETLMKGVKELKSEGIKKSPIYIESRNFNDYSRWKSAFAKAGFDYMPHLNFHVDCTDKEAMLERMSLNRRRQIKKAIKSGIEIKSGGITELEIKEWYEILKTLYRTKVKTPLFPLSFFLEFYLQGLGKYLLVKYEGKVIGGIMCPILDGKCIYEWFVCGLDNENHNLNPSVMATYAAMEYGHKHGLTRFDFMGAGKPNEQYGVRDFKEEFGGQLVEQGRFLLIQKPLLYQLGTIGVNILKRLP